MDGQLSSKKFRRKGGEPLRSSRRKEREAFKSSFSTPAGSVENAQRFPGEARGCGKCVDPKGGLLPVSCGPTGRAQLVLQRKIHQEIHHPFHARARTATERPTRWLLADGGPCKPHNLLCWAFSPG